MGLKEVLVLQECSDGLDETTKSAYRPCLGEERTIFKRPRALGTTSAVVRVRPPVGGFGMSW